MADIDPNFSCSDPALLRGNVTESVWMVLSEGPAHENSIIAIAAFQILFVVIGIPWNSIVFIAIIKKRLYNQPTYLLLLNLIVSDLLVCVCVLPFNIASAIAMEFAIGDSDYVRCQVCQLTIIIIVSLIHISVFSLALMSVDRLVYIKHPVNYSNIVTVRRVILVMVVMWISCTLISILPVFGFGEIKYSNLLSSCSLLSIGKTHLTANSNFILFVTLVDLFFFVATLVANIWLLVLVCKTVSQRNKKLTENKDLRCTPTQEQIDEEQKVKLKKMRHNVILVYVFGSIFAANVVLWLPTICISIASSIAGSNNIPLAAYAFQYVTFLSQSAVHPILETCLIGKATVMVFNCLCCCRKKKTFRTMMSKKKSSSSVPSAVVTSTNTGL